jgi:four helix bundle protein
MKDRYDVQIAGKQIIRSGTSVAANYREASRARSKADFISKIDICTQEADETLLWLEILKKGCHLNLEKIEPLKLEADELIAIFVTMSKNSKS